MWLLIAISGYFLFSITNVVDKLVLTKIKKPRVYATAVAVFGLLGLIFIFFGFKMPNNWIIFVSIIAGMIYIFALVPFYKGIQMGQTSRVVSFVGGLMPIFVLILGAISGIETLTQKQLIAFFIILAGSYLISLTPSKKKNAKLAFVWAFLAAILFGSFYFLSKYIFLNSDFVSGFVIMRIGGLIAGLVLLFWPGTLKDIMKNIKTRKKKQTQKKASLVLFSQICAAIGFVLVNYAVSIGKVSLVNAIAGTQFVFLLILTILLYKKFPQLKEKVTAKIIIQKIIAILFIALGLYLLVV